MIFAPRSCPSRPGLAMTTRIVPGTSAEYRGAPDRHRLVAGMAEPGERPLRVHARGRREPRAARLRAGSARSTARAEHVAGGRRDRDHALAPRPLGRPRALGLGHVLPLGERPGDRSRRCGCSPAAPSSSPRSASGSASPTCSSARSSSTEYEPDTPFSIGKLAVTPTRVPHYRLETYAFRVQSNGAVLDVLGRLGPLGRSW